VDTVLLIVMYVLMSVVIQPSWLPNPIKLIIIIIYLFYMWNTKLAICQFAIIIIIIIIILKIIIIIIIIITHLYNALRSEDTEALAAQNNYLHINNNNI